MFEELRPHLQDLRLRLMISLLCVIIAFVACFSFNQDIFNFIKQPIESAFKSGVQGKLIQVAPAEYLFVAIKVSFFSAFIISIPVIFWQFWLFVAPGLYKHEKKLVLPFVLFGSIMFALGLIFCYIVVFPFIIKYVLAFGNEVIEANIASSEYLGFFMRIMLAFGFVFELPVLAFFLGKVGLITDGTLKRYFRYAVVLIFVIAAIVTPPDVLSQLLLAFPMVALYGIAILILKFVNPESKADSKGEKPKDSPQSALVEVKEDSKNI
ncbi:twin-arginine translocase subunit TatC [Helicobacter saguini]|uniref:Sec-independent protein translocase protein TatC n=1 Tax=Helicobacter saguini TaxID=1548018 RepID=A0A347VSI1_9HELI|nr:twin-arginine translocase subunit TatC [Helicobacter saguini]MWV62496.1 twin-arginine translocase subunit TatC [Helicobacter saguini]MWV66831.1 twin-arginine translocase subunit TatC [Helicobacter saguini]MWV69181.1 twin-arginine translocase subunit TatC [Helicobacter saguini]MWV71264.1 twin-arginine translocase subunit TatC [Helicobacter saguini]TLD94218.1 twin-arginine translocase subunit TatC [Helicobacter saguini]